MLSVVIPAFNEQEMVPAAAGQIDGILSRAGIPHELIFIDDGSRDATWAEIRAESEHRDTVRGVHFSRNFRKEAAIFAGLQAADGDCVAVIDCDLQHPPECLPEIVEKFDEGYEVISMVRTKNKTAGFVKNFTSAAFYKLINHLSDVKFEANASDFFAVSKNAAEVLRNNYREKVRFLRGYVQSIGFEKTTIEYEARPRFAGESKYSLKKLFIFSISASRKILYQFLVNIKIVLIMLRVQLYNLP